MMMKRITTRSTAPSGRVIITTAEIDADVLAAVTSYGILQQGMASHGHRIVGDPLGLVCEFLAADAKILGSSEVPGSGLET